MAGKDFPKHERLLARRDFLQASLNGHKVHSAHFIILRVTTVRGGRRIGITVSRKVGSAVVRNRLKRFVREFYRLHKERFELADYTIIAKRGAERLDYLAVCNELDQALSRLHSRTC